MSFEFLYHDEVSWVAVRFNYWRGGLQGASNGAKVIGASFRMGTKCGVMPEEIQRIQQQIVFGIGFESRRGGQLDAVPVVLIE